MPLSFYGGDQYYYNYREACSIQLQESVIFTGGFPMLSRVQEYNLYGSVARLPDLNTGRDWHSCGHYVHNGQMVGSVFSYDIRSKQNKGSLKKHFIFDQCENDLFYSLNHLSSKKCYPQRRPPASVPCIFRLTIITF